MIVMKIQMMVVINVNIPVYQIVHNAKKVNVYIVTLVTLYNQRLIFVPQNVEMES